MEINYRKGLNYGILVLKYLKKGRTDVVVVKNRNRSEDVEQLANYLIYRYELRTGSAFPRSEMKLHALLYFSLRETLARYDDYLFEADIEVTNYGIHIPALNFFFNDNYYPVDVESFTLSELEMNMIDIIVERYAKYEGWVLRDRIREEECWRKGKRALVYNEKSTWTIDLDDIKDDAQLSKIKECDEVYGIEHNPFTEGFFDR